MELFKIPRKIYFLKHNGQFILDTGESQGTVDVTTTVDEDFEIYKELSKYSREVVGCVQLGFGQYEEEIQNGLPFTIDIENNTLIFDYSPMKNEIKNKITAYEQEIKDLQEKLAKLD